MGTTSLGASYRESVWRAKRAYRRDPCTLHAKHNTVRMSGILINEHCKPKACLVLVARCSALRAGGARSLLSTHRALETADGRTWPAGAIRSTTVPAVLPLT